MSTYPQPLTRTRTGTEARSFPCIEPETNRYRGCISVAKCKAGGQATCIMGRFAGPPKRTLEAAEKNQPQPRATVGRTNR